MKHIDDLFQQIMKLWDEGKFIRTTTIDGNGVSLYEMDNKYHLIWYTADHHILKYETIDESEIESIFRNADEFPWDPKKINSKTNLPESGPGMDPLKWLGENIFSKIPEFDFFLASRKLT